MKIDIFYFLIAFSIGIFLTYITVPVPTVIIQYPTPDNVGKITYKDKAGVCYKYEAEEVNCPNDKSKIVELPIQQDSEDKGLINNIKKYF